MPADTGVQKSSLKNVFGHRAAGTLVVTGTAIRENYFLANEQEPLDRDRHDYRNRPYLGKVSNHYIQSRDCSCLTAIPT